MVDDCLAGTVVLTDEGYVVQINPGVGTKEVLVAAPLTYYDVYLLGCLIIREGAFGGRDAIVKVRCIVLHVPGAKAPVIITTP